MRFRYDVRPASGRLVERYLPPDHGVITDAGAAVSAYLNAGQEGPWSQNGPKTV
jgi:hypothetical protein